MAGYTSSSSGSIEVRRRPTAEKPQESQVTGPSVNHKVTIWMWKHAVETILHEMKNHNMMKPLQEGLLKKHAIRCTLFNQHNGLAVVNGFSKHKYCLRLCRLQPERFTLTIRNNFPAC